MIVDADLAPIYGVTTKRLNEQVKRNIERYPEDFMFELSAAEKQQVVANCDHLKNLKFSSHLPHVFTEHGTVMAANVLNSNQAVKVSVFVVRAFIKLREMLSTHRELATKLDQLERKLQAHDQQIISLVQAMRELMRPPADPPRARIGFEAERACGQ